MAEGNVLFTTWGSGAAASDGGGPNVGGASVLDDLGDWGGDDGDCQSQKAAEDLSGMYVEI